MKLAHKPKCAIQAQSAFLYFMHMYLKSVSENRVMKWDL